MTSQCPIWWPHFSFCPPFQSLSPPPPAASDPAIPSSSWELLRDPVLAWLPSHLSGTPQFPSPSLLRAGSCGLFFPRTAPLQVTCSTRGSNPAYTVMTPTVLSSPLSSTLWVQPPLNISILLLIRHPKPSMSLQFLLLPLKSLLPQEMETPSSQVQLTNSQV